MKTNNTLPASTSHTYLYNHIESHADQYADKTLKGPHPRRLINQIRICICIMIAGLFVSGVTAFPIETELHWLVQHNATWPQYMQSWLLKVYQAVKESNYRYPFLSYGTDWLAFAHIMLAVLFIGPLRNPARNIWVVQFGMIACAAILPLTFIAGPIRGIPLFWNLVDSSFGFIGIIPLYIAYKNILKLRAVS